MKRRDLLKASFSLAPLFWLVRLLPVDNQRNLFRVDDHRVKWGPTSVYLDDKILDHCFEMYASPLPMTPIEGWCKLVANDKQYEMIREGEMSVCDRNLVYEVVRGVVWWEPQYSKETWALTQLDFGGQQDEKT